MIYRLTYCNKDGVEARVDIQKGLATPVIEVEGTERPFILSYNNDKGDKSGMFLSSSADIEIYETTDFNIDNLKTSNETELSVTHYINNVVSWQGFIIPDFFSIEVRNNPVITMTASDRLGTLKNVTLSDLPSMISLRELAVLCLSKTGLSLPLKTIADFSNDGTVNAFFSYYVDSQRIKDIKGRSISCYDILSSILIASNSKLVQRAGEWVIINKLQHEIGSGKIYSSLSSFTNYLENIYNFEEVSIGARRTIMPVAGSVGIYHEHGGRKSHPVNYDYSLGLSGWNSVNGFVATIENRHITMFLGGTPLFDPEKTVKQYLLNSNNWIDNTNNLNTAPYITTDAIPINSPRADRVEVTVDISSIMAEKLSSYTAISFLRYAVILTNGVKTYTLTKAGIFEILDPENISGHSLLLRGGQQPPLLLASPSFSNSDSFKGLFEVGEDDDVNNYSATIRVYGSGNQYVTVNYALIKFSDVSELPKGTMYKTEQGEVFTKAYDIETSIFGDYLLSGLDGYFYRYPNDDTSSIYKDINTLSSPIWTTPMIPSETSELPILHHSMRQMRRMFSVAHDLLSAELEASNFDPLAIFVACEKRYTVVSAQFDFFKSNLSVELEEVAFQSASVRDFIYSYFGEGESGIKSIGGISGGGGGTGGGGLTPEQLEILSWWKKDPDRENTIFTEMNAYSTKELSAYGLGPGSGGGGGGTVVSWGTESNGTIPLTVEGISKTIALKSGLDLKQDKLIAGSGITITGNTISANIQELSWDNISGKPLTYTPSAHTHNASDINAGVLGIARIPTGTTSTTVALGNHTHTFASLTSKPTTLSGYGITNAYTKTEVDTELDTKVSSVGLTAPTGFSVGNSPITSTGNIALAFATGYSLPTTAKQGQWDTAYSERHTHSNKSVIDGITSALVTNWNTAYTQRHTHSNKAIIDQLTQDNINVLKKMSMDGLNIKVDTNLYSTGEVSAYGIGSGSGGGGGSLVSWGTESNSFIPLTVEGISKTVALLGHTHTFGSLTNKPTTLTGYGITDVYTKLETNTLLDGKASISALNSKLETSIFNTHNNDNIRHITGAERTKWDGVVTDFAELEIGGRNLVVNSEVLIMSSESIDHDYYSFTLKNKAGDNPSLFIVKHDPNVENYTLSFKSNTNNIAVTRVYYWSEKPTNSHTTNRIGWGTNLISGSKLIIPNNPDIKYIGVGINGNSLTGDDYLPMRFWDWKLEKGTIPTDWTPAPEDQVSDWNTTDVNSFSFIKNKPTLLSQFTDNIGVATHIANKANPHNVTTAQIGAVDLTTNQNIGGVKSFTDDSFFRKNIILGQSLNSYIHFSEISGGDGFSLLYDGAGAGDNNFLHITGGIGSVNNQTKHLTIRRNSGNVGIGTTAPQYKLDVLGTGRFTGNLTASSYNTANWKWEQVDSELVFKYNNVVKARLLANGSFVATGEITAYE